MRGKTYRTRTTRPDMSRTDWLIAIGMAVPFALFFGLLIVLAVFG